MVLNAPVRMTPAINIYRYRLSDMDDGEDMIELGPTPTLVVAGDGRDDDQPKGLLTQKEN
jgi:hypothetical protein